MSIGSLGISMLTCTRIGDLHPGGQIRCSRFRYILFVLVTLVTRGGLGRFMWRERP